MKTPVRTPPSPGAAQALAEEPAFAGLIEALREESRRDGPSIAPAVRAALRSGAPAAQPLTPGAAEALADNPEAVGLIQSLADAPARDFPSIAPAVAKALHRRNRLARLRRRALGALTASAAAAAALLLALRPGAPLEAGTAPAEAALAAAAPAAASAPESRSADVEALLAGQRPDGSWIPATGGSAMAPAATGLAVCRLLDAGLAPDAEPLRAAAAWLRANQRDDGGFPMDNRPYNLALPAIALLRLYDSGAYPELFTPVDGAIASVRRRLSLPTQTPAPDEASLASALVLADRQGWSDDYSGDLRLSLRRMTASHHPRYAAVADAQTYAEKRSAVLHVASRITL